MAIECRIRYHLSIKARVSMFCVLQFLCLIVVNGKNLTTNLALIQHVGMSLKWKTYSLQRFFRRMLILTIIGDVTKMYAEKRIRNTHHTGNGHVHVPYQSSSGKKCGIQSNWRCTSFDLLRRWRWTKRSPSCCVRINQIPNVSSDKLHFNLSSDQI